MRRLGRTELSVSPVGFGGYRVHVDDSTQRQALEQALRSGINLIDTSTNYCDGGSEQLVGKVLGELIDSGVVRRDEVVVVSKAGYIQRKRLDEMRTAPKRPANVVEYLPHCWHCIDPEFLLEELDRSRKRLGLGCIDVYLLHNPEYFLIDRNNREGEVTQSDRELFYSRIGRAFAVLEEAVRQGLIGCYGVSSNGFIEAPDNPSFVDLERLLTIARERSDHKFAVVQFPMNLYELEAATRLLPSSKGPRTLVEIAREGDLGMLVNRPLNAYVHEPTPKLIRLADPAEIAPSQPEPDGLLRRVEQLEQHWAHKDVAAFDRANESEADALGSVFRWGTELRRSLSQFDQLSQWRDLRTRIVEPALAQQYTALSAALDAKPQEAFQGWWDEYAPALQAALDAIGAQLSRRHQAVADAIAGKLDHFLPETWRERALSVKAVRTLLTAPITSVLVGMRRPSYVYDMLEVRELMDDPQPFDLSAIANKLSPIVREH